MKQYIKIMTCVAIIGLFIVYTACLQGYNQRINHIEKELSYVRQNIQIVKSDNAKSIKQFQADIYNQLDNMQALNKQNWILWDKFFTRKASE